MPTGYTAKLMEQGETFQQFAMQCARAFGALVEMRDDPMDAPIPEFKPSPYYTESLAKHEAKLAELQMMSDAERLAYGESARKARLKMLEDWLAKDREGNERLDAMRAEVLKWTPPSPDHQGMKNFMLEQLQTSLSNLSYARAEIAKVKNMAPIDCWAEAVDSESRGVTYVREGWAKEIERTRERNLWVKQLRESLMEKVAQ